MRPLYRKRSSVWPQGGFVLGCVLALILFGRPVAAADIKVACVGDSITAGYQASSTSAAYPAVLGTLLGTGWQVENDGNSGKTMIKKPSDGGSFWDQTEFTRSKSFLPNIVVLMLGTNDAKTTNWNSGNNTYTADYKSMVGIYLGLSSKPKVYAMLPPPALSSQYSISADVIQKEIIPIIKSVAADTGIGVIDLNTAFNANDAKSMMGSDGIHPNDKGYKFIAQTVANAIQADRVDGGAPDAVRADSAVTVVDASGLDARMGDAGEGTGGRDGGTAFDGLASTGGDAAAGSKTGSAGAAGGGAGYGGAGGNRNASASSAGAQGSGPAGSGGTGGSTGSAGLAGAMAGALGGSSTSASSVTAGAAGTRSSTSANSGSGCSCRLSSEDRASSASLLLLTALLGVTCIRRRTRGR